jgi:hypothetical protein
MIENLKNLGKSLGAVAVLATISSTSYAAGLGDIAQGIDLSDGKTAVVSIAVALGGFLVLGMAARYILGFMKRI